MKYQYRVLGMLSLLSVITYLDRICIAVAGPRMQDALHIGPEQWGWVTGAFFLAYGAFEVPTGALGDRIGARRVLTRIVLWWSAFTSLTGAVSSLPWLLVVRFCFGMGEAGAYPNASVVIGRWMPSRKRARAWGTIWMTSQLGAAIAPLLVVPVQMHYGWRASFLVFGVLGLVWSAVWYAWFRDTPREMAGVSDAERREIGDVGADAPHAAFPLGALLRSGRMWHIAAVGASYVYSIAFFQSWLQTYLVKGRGFTEAALMLSTLPYLVGACANVSGGFVSDHLVQRLGLRRGRRTVGVAGLTAAALAMVGAIMARDGLTSLLCLSLTYGAILFQQPNLCAVCLDTGRRHAGAVFGLMNTVCQVAAAVSAFVFGFLVARFGSYEAPFVPMLVLLGVGAALWCTLDPTQELFAAQAPPPDAAPAHAA
jgi:MFS family permease